MAIWQFWMHLVDPSHRLPENAIPPSVFRERRVFDCLVETFGPPATTDGLDSRWGDYDHHDVHAFSDVAEVFCRADLRRDPREFILKIAYVCQRCGLIAVDAETGLQSALEADILRAALRSRAMEFCRDPHGFLDKLKDMPRPTA